MESIKQRKKFLVCLDSDGTVFNTMEIKHKECVIPVTISEWGFQDISTYIRETMEYVNLYSKYRGINRFKALIKVFELLSSRPELKELEYKLPEIDSLQKWVDSAPRLGNDDLYEFVEKTQDAVLKRVFNWTKTIDKYVYEKINKVQPFTFVPESLEIISRHANIIVVSNESSRILQKEWEENGLIRFVNTIAGREAGSKKDILNQAVTIGYETNCVLMIGDAPGDLEAADSNNILFYPINPKFESYSWKKFCEEAFNKFIDGCYKGYYQDNLISEYMHSLDSCCHIIE